MELPIELARAAEFHTHLGPYLVVGLRIGRVVTRELGDEPFAYKLVAHTGVTPPHSCLVDGLQMATPCTTGNGCLEVGTKNRMTVEATARDGRAISVRLRTSQYDRIENDCTEENQEGFALEIWDMAEGDLLEVVAK